MKKEAHVLIFTTMESRENNVEGMNCINPYVEHTFASSDEAIPITIKAIRSLMSQERVIHQKNYKCEKVISKLNYILIFNKDLSRNIEREEKIKLAFSEA
jgi:hypothetical protein